MSSDDSRRAGSYSGATTRKAAAVGRRRGASRVPTLTIGYHCELGRIGDEVRLTHLKTGGVVEISRLMPLFRAPRSGRSQALDDPFVSRRPITLKGVSGGGVEVTRAPDRMAVIVDGVPLTDSMTLTSVQLDAGVVLEIAERVALVLHWSEASATAADHDLGMVGHSDAVTRLRADIQLMAEHDVPTLIRGETGTGKELVAHGIHTSSGRAREPFVSVNMAAIPETTAASQLFGHVKGAFTGAATDHPGFFGRAHRGTLFLDEIGEASPEIQAMLLRALETGEVQPVGARTTRVVDVRPISATDADLESAVESGAFREPLLHRLSGFQIDVPPLRERRQDIGRLLAHFMTEELRQTGDDRMLRQRADAESPWLAVGVVGTLIRHQWPGNVRQLRNVARRVVLEARRGPVQDVFGALQRMLRDAGHTGTGTTAALETTPELPSLTRAAQANLKPEDIDEDTLKTALKANKWRLGATARALGIARSSLYQLIERSPGIRKAGDLTAEEIAAAGQAHNNDAKAMAEQLQVSKQGLLRRMKQLGV